MSLPSQIELLERAERLMAQADLLTEIAAELTDIRNILLRRAAMERAKQRDALSLDYDGDRVVLVDPAHGGRLSFHQINVAKPGTDDGQGTKQ